MKISQFIKGLTAIKKELGNLEVIYSSDDEGNTYHQIYFAPTGVCVSELKDYMSSDDFNETGLQKPNAIIIN